MISCTTRVRSAPKVAPVPRKPLIGEKDPLIMSSLRAVVSDKDSTMVASLE
jgi:hypothetical protein